MKSFFVLAALATSALAQRIAIGIPTDRQEIPAGSNFTVEVDRPNSLTGSTEVAIAIGLASCSRFPGGSCASLDPSELLGTILYAGPYSPQLSNSSKPPHQNFTVTIPNDFPHGDASFTVSHFSLVGAGPFAFFETQNTTVQIV
ncbi:hypothetical protein QCA50_015407 [Cerrena zonata]|uniref:Uncharacterized protein n=1 Tax=Cerrena zonata TaxID=2478898 RepID=A0AAW0FKM0_9APHY